MNPQSSPYAVIVNDEQVQLALLSILTREAGFLPLPFSNAEEALWHLSNRIKSTETGIPQLPSFIITDLFDDPFPKHVWDGIILIQEICWSLLSTYSAKQ